MPTIPLPPAFLLLRRLAVEPVHLQLNLEAPFRCLPTIPPEFFAVQEAGRSGDDSMHVPALVAAFRTCLVPEERDRYDRGVDAAPDRPEHIDVVALLHQMQAYSAAIDEIARSAHHQTPET